MVNLTCQSLKRLTYKIEQDYILTGHHYQCIFHLLDMTKCSDQLKVITYSSALLHITEAASKKCWQKRETGSRTIQTSHF